jgi:hypothetical protein
VIPSATEGTVTFAGADFPLSRLEFKMFGSLVDIEHTTWVSARRVSALTQRWSLAQSMSRSASKSQNIGTLFDDVEGQRSARLSTFPLRLQLKRPRRSCSRARKLARKTGVTGFVVPERRKGFLMSS